MVSLTRNARATGGTAMAGLLALAALVCGCVFAALAGPAVSLRLRTDALHQSTGAPGSLTTTVQVKADWMTFIADMYGGVQTTISDQNMAVATTLIGQGLAGTPLPLSAGRWASLTTPLFRVVAGAQAIPAGYRSLLEVTSRYPLASQTRLVSGTLSVRSAPPDAMGVAVTERTAARFHWHPGSRITVGSKSATALLYVTAVVAPRDADGSFWTTDPLAAAPSLNLTNTGAFWDAAAFADPGQLTVMETAFCGARDGGCPPMQLLWSYPVDMAAVNADQASTLAEELGQVSSTTPAMSGLLGNGTAALAIESSLSGPLAAFVAAQTAVLALLLLVFVSLITVGAAVIVLAGRMIVARRQDELTTLRARGASARQVGMLMLRGSALAAVPAAACGLVLALVLVPGAGLAAGGSATLSWALTAITVSVAVGVPSLLAAWRVRTARRAVNQAAILTAETRVARFSSRALRTVTIQVTACAAAVAGLAVLRGQGVPASGEVNLYLTFAPVLAAIPAAVLILRLYPLIIRALLHMAARRTGATGYVGLAGSARSSLASILPAFTLILALTLATFAGMVNDAVARGQVAAAWQATGADAVITTNPAVSPVTPTVARDIAGVPGVRRMAQVWTTSWTTPGGQQVTIAAVDPASYAALTAATPFPVIHVPADGTGPSGIVPVLASPAAVAVLGRGEARLTGEQLGPIAVRVTGIVTSAPAEPGGGLFLLMATRPLPGALGTPAPNVVLLGGNHIDQAALNAVVTRDLPAAGVAFRSAVLARLRAAPLPRAGSELMWWCAVATGVFGLLNLVLGLALGARDRDMMLARLSVMGHERATRLVLLETLPAVLAAVAGTAICALLLPTLTAGALDLSVFTGSGTPVQVRPDLAVLGLLTAGIVPLTALALAVEIRRSRRRGVSGLLRVGT